MTQTAAAAPLHPSTPIMTGRFVILGMQRSGTTYAAAALRGHPQVSMLGPELKQEFFSHGMQRFVSGEGTLEAVRRAYPKMFDAMTAQRDGALAWGAKSAVATHAEAVLLCDCLEQFFCEAKVVLVTRDDAVASYGSLERAKSSGVWHSFAGGSTTGALRIAPRKLFSYLEVRELVTRRFRTLSRSRDFLELNYERDIADGGAPQKLFRFLGLDPVDPDWIRIKKLNPDARDYIKNYDKLAAAAAAAARPQLGDAEEAARADAVRGEQAREQSSVFLLGVAADHADHGRWTRAAEALNVALARADAPLRPNEMGAAYAALERADEAECPAAPEILARVEAACGDKAAFLLTRARRREQAGSDEGAVLDLTAALCGDGVARTDNHVPSCFTALRRLLDRIGDPALSAKTIEQLAGRYAGDERLAELAAAKKPRG